MVYVSDHGESLGENGVYLHGLPKAIAPKSQIHVPVFLWAPVGSSDVDFHQTLKLKDNEFTHSHISDLLLKLAEIQSDAYKLNEQPMIIMGD
jgi:lipid A ethanolaminephosphotransferase